MQYYCNWTPLLTNFNNHETKKAIFLIRYTLYIHKRYYRGVYNGFQQFQHQPI